MPVYMDKPAPSTLRSAIYMRCAIYMNTGARSFSVSDVYFSMAQRALTPEEVKQLPPGAQLAIHFDASGATVQPLVVQKVRDLVAGGQTFQMNLVSSTGISLPGGSYAPDGMNETNGGASHRVHEITLRKIR